MYRGVPLAAIALMPVANRHSIHPSRSGRITIVVGDCEMMPAGACIYGLVPPVISIYVEVFTRTTATAARCETWATVSKQVAPSLKGDNAVPSQTGGTKTGGTRF